MTDQVQARELAAMEQRAVAAEAERDDVIAALETLRAHFLAKIEAGEVAPMPICGWCGMPMTDVEAFKAHALVCGKSPPVQRALAAEAEAKRLAQVADGNAHVALACTRRAEAAEEEARGLREALAQILGVWDNAKDNLRPDQWAIRYRAQGAENAARAALAVKGTP